MTDELLPCPFCGNKEPYLETTDYNGLDRKDFYFYSCGDCGCMMWAEKTKEQAVKTWNTRFENKEIDK